MTRIPMARLPIVWPAGPPSKYPKWGKLMMRLTSPPKFCPRMAWMIRPTTNRMMKSTSHATKRSPKLARGPLGPDGGPPCQPPGGWGWGVADQGEPESVGSLMGHNLDGVSLAASEEWF